MTPPTLLDLCRFLRGNSPGLRAVPVKGFGRWVNWYLADARVGIIREAGKIVAAAIGRCLDDPAQAADGYFHNESGRIVWIQDIVSLHPQGLPILIQHAVRRFGPREAFAGSVFFRAGELRMLPWTTVERLSRGGTRHGIDQHSATASAA